MKNTVSRVFLTIFLLVPAAAFAQDYPSNLIAKIPEASLLLYSDDARERISVVTKLIERIPMSCTLQTRFTHEIPEEEYLLVLDQVLELDLSELNTKEDVGSWSMLFELITKVKSEKHLEIVAERYLSLKSETISYGIMYSITRMGAVRLDRYLEPILNTSDPNMLRIVIDTLVNLKSKVALPALVRQLEDPKESVRYGAIRNLQKINAVEAAGEISARLIDESRTVRYYALEALDALNSSSIADALWKHFGEETDEQLTAYSLTILLHIGDERAVPFAIRKLKDGIAGIGSETYYTFQNRSPPKVLIPAFIALYYQEEPMFESARLERNWRRMIFNKLVHYRTPLALSIYRENMFGTKGVDDEVKLNTIVADIRYELDDPKLVEDLILGVSGMESTRYKWNYGYRRAAAAAYLAGKSEASVASLLLDVVEDRGVRYSGKILANLNRHLDSELWDEINETQVGGTKFISLADYVKELAKFSGTEIVFEKAEGDTIEPCRPGSSGQGAAVPCVFASNGTLIQALNRVFSNSEKYVWMFRDKKIVVLPKDKAIGIWRNEILPAL